MNNPQSSRTPNRKVGIYDRLGQSVSNSPTKMLGIGIAALAVLIVLIVVLARYS